MKGNFAMPASEKKEIPVFFSVDCRYIPFLGVAIHSLKKNLAKNSHCTIHVLYTDIPEAERARITALSDERATIRFTNVEKEVTRMVGDLKLRDYYTVSIYYRLFIASLFPEYEKAIYLDADVVLNRDLTEFFDLPLNENLVGAISDDIVANHPDFIRYAEEGLGIPAPRYFNSGVLLMNLAGFRREKIGEQFFDLLNHYHFDTIAPDQDYLNHLCRDRVLYVEKGWNKMSLDENYDGMPALIHYNMFFKPWLYRKVCYGDYFWNYAKETPFYEEIKAMRDKFGKDKIEVDEKAERLMHENALRICASPDNIRNTLLKDSQI